MPLVRYPIRFDRWYRVLSMAVLVPPSSAYVEVDDGEVRVRMGWAFRARFPRAVVASAREDPSRPLSRGAHGWAGRWLVNGSGEGIVDIALARPQLAHVAGLPVTASNLAVSVEDPAGLVAALTGPA